MLKDLNTLAYENGVMPILFADDLNATERVVRAIEQSTIPAVEILQRGDIALQTLKDAVKLKKNAYVGAGTVCTLEHGKQVVDAGADFIVSPGFNPELVEWCVLNHVPIIPGVSSVSEVMMAANLGLTLVKFFPFYELGGEAYLNGISGPFPQMKFVITGNCDDREFRYLENKKIAAIGGVWMFQSETDHTIVSEEVIMDRLNKTVALARHYRNRPW